MLWLEGDDIEKKQFRRIGTHDGKFHADEVMATAILMQIFEVELIRSRDEDILKGLDIVYDVGGGEFDHHGLDKRYRDNGVPYASCGLIWKVFGREVVRFKAPGQGEKEVEEVFEYVDRVLIEGIDALDNGMRLDDGRISIMSITSIISGFNPPWDSDMAEDKAFDIVVELVSSVLSNTIDNRLSVLRAREKVINAYHDREIAELLKLDVYCPYGETLQEVDKNKEVLFVVYPRKDSYAIQTVRDFGREDRKKLPEAWAGLRDEELAELTRVEDAVFCHSGRFIAVAESYEGIMKLARMAIEEQDAGLEEEPGEAPSEKWAMKLIRRILSRR